MKIIDPHIHLFNLEQGNYHWLKTENPPFWPDKALINKTFTENNLALNPPLELSGFVHIEAGFDNKKPWRELTTLEETTTKPFSAIANIDLTLTTVNFQHQLNTLAEHSSFVGVRHILDNIAISLLTNKQVITNFNIINNFTINNNCSLLFETQLPLAEQSFIGPLYNVVKNNPNIHFIINHAGFPPLKSQKSDWQHWQNNLVKLAAHQNVTIKCSGWEMIDRQYESDWLNKILSAIFDIFGVDKMMLASNFPLCLFSRKSYQEYWQALIASDFFQSRNEQEKNALCYNNAHRYYHL